MALITNHFSTNISKKQSSDSGMAAVLILMLIGFFSGNDLYFKIAIPVLIINMTAPMFYYPFAIIWLGISSLLGSIMSKVILTVVYIVMVIPTSMLRRLMGKDSLKLSEFKKGSESVMILRNHRFKPTDMEKPY